MSSRREKIVKVRMTEAEWTLLDYRRRDEGVESCAEYIRRRALEPTLGTGAISELIGQVGLTLNALDANPKHLEPVTNALKELVREIRDLQST